MWWKYTNSDDIFVLFSRSYDLESMAWSHEEESMAAVKAGRLPEVILVRKVRSLIHKYFDSVIILLCNLLSV